MLNIQIDDPALEKSLKQTFGDDTKSIAEAFLRFVQQQKIKKDIGISIEELDKGQGVPLSEAIRDVRAKYES